MMLGAQKKPLGPTWYFISGTEKFSDVQQSASAGVTPNEEDEKEEQRQASLERELTNRYLAGELTFQDYCRQIDPDSEEEEIEAAELRAKAAVSEDEDFEGLDDEDQEWKPKGKRAKKPKKDDDDDDQDPEEMSKFAEELRQTTRQQLGKKRARVGVAPRRNKLDPALQVTIIVVDTFADFN